MKTYLFAGLVTIIVTFILGLITIPVLRRVKLGQPILKYVENHKSKNGTPTMGGLFFIIPASIIFLIFSGAKSNISNVSVALGIVFLIVGFLDDFIKTHYSNNQGLKPYQKIIFQLIISIFAGVFAYQSKLTIFFIPFTKISVNLGVATIPIVAIIFIAITNSVNLTDGLDGLAGSVSFVYLIFIAFIIILELNVFTELYINKQEYQNLVLLSVILAFAVLGFLIFNVNKAKVFMGDTGSLSLGGFIGAISVFSLNSFFIPIIGIMFVISSISVIIQVVHYKRTKKRVFLMAPYHHHLQLKGNSESQIAFWYTLVTLIFGCLCVIALL